MTAVMTTFAPSGRHHLRLAGDPDVARPTSADIERLRDELGEASDSMLWLSPVQRHSPDHLVRVLLGFRGSLLAAVGTWADETSVLRTPQRPQCVCLRNLQRAWVAADRALAEAERAVQQGERVRHQLGVALSAIGEMDRLAKGLIRTAQLRSATPLQLPRHPRRRRLLAVAA